MNETTRRCGWSDLPTAECAHCRTPGLPGTPTAGEVDLWAIADLKGPQIGVQVIWPEPKGEAPKVGAAYTLPEPRRFIVECRWAGSDHPRYLPGRHLDQCPEGCRGCQPCPERHCCVCGVDHVTADGRGTDETCATCLGETREALAEIVELTRQLRGQALARSAATSAPGHDVLGGEAMVLLGPTADPEANQHMHASALAGRIDDSWTSDDGDGDEHAPLRVLGTWEEIWRDYLDQPSTERITVRSAAVYLDQHLTRMAQTAARPFEEFARDLRTCRAHLETVLRAGEQIEPGAPCPECRKPLVLAYGSGFLEDRWICQRHGCGVTYTRASYRGWVERDARERADRLTAADLEIRFGDRRLRDDPEKRLKATHVRVWGSRNLIAERGRTEHGVKLYAVADVLVRLLDEDTPDAESA